METVVITGANRGIGLALAREGVKRGYRVIGSSRQPREAIELNDLAREAVGLCEVLPLDVVDPASVEAFARSVERKVDLLINNAGIFGDGAFSMSAPSQSFESIDFEIWRRVMETNLHAPFRLTRALIANLSQSANPRVIMMSSDLGSITNNHLGQSHAYRTSKAGLNMVARGLANDLRKRAITVVSMAPGWCRTDLGGADAPIDPADSARGQFDVYAGLTLEKSGGFVNFEGKTVPW